MNSDPVGQMTKSQRIADSLLIWILVSAVFVAAVFLSVSPFSLLFPHGDAAFGFSLGLVPSIILGVITYIGFSLHLLYLGFTRSELLSRKLKAQVIRFLWVGLSVGIAILINAIAVEILF